MQGMAQKTLQVFIMRLRIRCPNKIISFPKLKELLEHKVVLEVPQPIATENRVQTPLHFCARFGFFDTHFLLRRDGRLVCFNAQRRRAATVDCAAVVVVEDVVHGAGQVHGWNAAAAHKTTVSAFSKHADCSDNIAHEARVQLRQVDEKRDYWQWSD